MTFSIAVVETYSVVLASPAERTTVVSRCCPSTPGISEATQVYGTSIEEAVIVTALFLVPSVLFHSAELTACSISEFCRK